MKKICGALDIRIIEKTVLPRSHVSNGAGEVTLKVIRRHATLLIQLNEKSCGLGEVIGCHHPRYQRVLLHNCWLHTRFVVRQGHTAYELCADRPFTGRLALLVSAYLVSQVVYERFPNMDRRHMARKDRQQRCSYHSCSWKSSVVWHKERQASPKTVAYANGGRS